MIKYDVFDGNTPICTFSADANTWLLQVLDNDEVALTVDELNRMSDCLGKEFPGRTIIVIADRAKVVRRPPPRQSHSCDGYMVSSETHDANNDYDENGIFKDAF